MKLPLLRQINWTIALLLFVGLSYATGWVGKKSDDRPKLVEFCNEQTKQMELPESQEQQKQFRRCIEANRQFGFF